MFEFLLSPPKIVVYVLRDIEYMRKFVYNTVLVKHGGQNNESKRLIKRYRLQVEESP
jgi:hypothetical protein